MLLQGKKICFPTDTLIPLWPSLVFCSDLLSCWGSPVEGGQVGGPDWSSQVIWPQMNLPPLLFESSRQVVLSFSSDHIPAFDIAASNRNLIWTFILSRALTSLKIRVQLISFMVWYIKSLIGSPWLPSDSWNNLVFHPVSSSFMPACQNLYSANAYCHSTALWNITSTLQ